MSSVVCDCCLLGTWFVVSWFGFEFAVDFVFCWL